MPIVKATRTVRGRGLFFAALAVVTQVVERGQELGAFNLGSTVVLLLGKADGLRAQAEPGGLVKMGQALWRPEASR